MPKCTLFLYSDPLHVVYIYYLLNFTVMKFIHYITRGFDFDLINSFFILTCILNFSSLKKGIIHHTTGGGLFFEFKMHTIMKLNFFLNYLKRNIFLI
jgi:hypothetical protein